MYVWTRTYLQRYKHVCENHTSSRAMLFLHRWDSLRSAAAGFLWKLLHCCNFPAGQSPALRPCRGPSARSPSPGAPSLLCPPPAAWGTRWEESEGHGLSLFTMSDIGSPDSWDRITSCILWKDARTHRDHRGLVPGSSDAAMISWQNWHLLANVHNRTQSTKSPSFQQTFQFEKHESSIHSSSKT